MKQCRRIYYTETQKTVMWERWQQGESLQHIAQLFDRNRSSIQRILAESGGIRPALRHRAPLTLTWPNAKKSRERSLWATRSSRLRSDLTGLHPRSAARLLMCTES